MVKKPRVIPLIEYESKELPSHSIREEDGRILWQEFGSKIDVEFPSPKTQDQWKLTSQGWVGYIPLTHDLGISIQPKIPISNIFRMLEYAYRLKSFELLDDVFEANSLQEFYEELANILAKLVLSRSRKGYYRSYLGRIECLPYVTGQLDIEYLIHRPWKVFPRCNYQDYTPDIEDNQLLAWTLFVVARSGLCTERVLPRIRRAYRSLQGFVKILPFSPDDCVHRLYNRLNQDYHQLHSLCRFFLANSGPTHQLGEKPMLPFLVNVANLFELFVAEWLLVQLPEEYSIEPQETVFIDKEGNLLFKIDLVLYDLDRGRVQCVLDTKYKESVSPSAKDLEQVIAYAHIKRCQEAILIYPKSLSRPLDVWAEDIKVRSLTFELDGDLEEAGQRFLNDLGLDIEV